MSGDFEAILAESRRNGCCAECGAELHSRVSARSAFCSEQHRLAFRDRRRYRADPEAQRERSRRYYWENRERVLEKAAAKRGRVRQPGRLSCSECGRALEGRQRVTCGSNRCRAQRFKRLRPVAYAERERQKAERRRARRRELREGGGS